MLLLDFLPADEGVSFARILSHDQQYLSLTEAGCFYF